DQCPATIKTTLARLELLMTIPRLKKRRVLLLGDDDLLSVAIVAAGLSAGVTVVDLDDLLLARIARWVKPSTVELLHHDLRLDLPDTLSHGYDIVFTDPPYTTAGQLLFLRAAVNALRNVRSASLFLCASSLYLAPPQIQMIIEASEKAGLKLIRVA